MELELCIGIALSSRDRDVPEDNQDKFDFRAMAFAVTPVVSLTVTLVTS